MCFQPVVFTTTVGGPGKAISLHLVAVVVCILQQKEITNKKVIDPEVQVSVPDCLATSTTDCGEPIENPAPVCVTETDKKNQRSQWHQKKTNKQKITNKKHERTFFHLVHKLIFSLSKKKKKKNPTLF